MFKNLETIIRCPPKCLQILLANGTRVGSHGNHAIESFAKCFPFIYNTLNVKCFYVLPFIYNTLNTKCYNTMHFKCIHFSQSCTPVSQ